MVCRALALLAVAIAATACQGPEPDRGPWLPLADPQLERSDARSFADFDHRSRGQLKLGSGWYQPEYESRWRRWSLVSWAGPRATLYFAEPLTAPVELELECASAPTPKTQQLSVAVNGHEVGSRELAPSFQAVRFPVPAEHLRQGLNRIDLAFAQAVGAGDGTGRKKAAAFRGAALLPPGVERRGLRRHGSAVDWERREVHLRTGSPLALPLPASPLTLRIEATSRVTAECSVHLSLSGADHTWQELWQAAGTAVHDSTVQIPGHARRARELLLEAGGRCGRDGVRLRLQPRPGAATPATGSGGRPDVYVYMVDTLRADALEPYGSARPTSPAITEFSRDAVLFDRAWSTSAWTLPATMSALTGLYPARHGYMRGGHRPEAPTAALLGERLAEAGYETLAISQSKVVSAAFDFDRGFETFLFSDALSRGRLESGAVRHFLWHHLRSRPGSKPLFAYIHTVDPHAPYNPQGEDRRFLSRRLGTLREWKYNPDYFLSHDLAHERREVDHMRALYDGEVHHADREFGAFVNLLRQLGRYDSSMVILVSDHGDEFAEHGGFGHSRSLYEELVRVPLLVKFPGGWQAGTRVHRRTSLVDLVPTVLRAAEALHPEDRFDGVPVQDLVQAQPVEHGRQVLAELQVGGGGLAAELDLVALAAEQLKCLHSGNHRDAANVPVPQLRAYDLGSDPGEQHPLDPSSAQARRCGDLLRPQLEQVREDRPQERAVDEETRAALRALGYLDAR